MSVKDEQRDHGFDEPLRPHRNDGYVDRTRVHLRVDDRIVVGLDQLAVGLGLSRSHVCDVILRIAVEDGGKWLCGQIRDRVKKSMARFSEKSLDSMQLRLPGNQGGA